MKLIRKKEVWLPTWQGFVLLLALTAGLVFVAIRHLYPFLAQNHPVASPEIIIIEGWLADAELAEAAKTVQSGQVVVTTGGPIKFGAGLLKEKNYAEVTADRLRLLGIEEERILCVPAPDVQIDRTYASALAARQALEQRGLLGKPCNIYSMGVHGRRSLYLYKRAFGADYPIGMISLETQEVDLRHWWRSSLAFKQVLSELFSWFYTLFSSCKYA